MIYSDNNDKPPPPPHNYYGRKCLSIIITMFYELGLFVLIMLCFITEGAVIEIGGLMILFLVPLTIGTIGVMVLLLVFTRDCYNKCMWLMTRDSDYI